MESLKSFYLRVLEGMNERGGELRFILVFIVSVGVFEYAWSVTLHASVIIVVDMLQVLIIFVVLVRISQLEGVVRSAATWSFGHICLELVGRQMVKGRSNVKHEGWFINVPLLEVGLDGIVVPVKRGIVFVHGKY